MLPLSGATVGIEALARWMHLDAHQGSAIALPRDPREGPTDSPIRLSGVGYPPRLLAIDDQGFSTGFGRCDSQHKGPTLLALGDSTTVMSTTSNGRHADFINTWPLMLGQHLGPAWQVCVIAESGYHPSDLVALLVALGDRVKADLTVLMICENDLANQAPRHVDRVDGTWIIRTEPQNVEVYRSLWHPWLHDHSEAFRYLSWRASRWTGESVKTAYPHDERTTVSALAASSLRSAHVYYLPPLVPGGDADPQVTSLATQSGRDITPIPLPPIPTDLRREPADSVHLNRAGHAWVAEFMARQLSSEAQLGPSRR